MRFAFALSVAGGPFADLCRLQRPSAPTNRVGAQSSRVEVVRNMAFDSCFVVFEGGSYSECTV
eukprot:4323116-Amphidinium_carterae.1